VLTTARDWGVQLEGAAVSWAYRVMERAASAGNPRGVLVPIDDGRWFFPPAGRRDAEQIRRVLISTVGVDLALVSVITVADALRRGARAGEAVRVR
jgi:hypothetical protein